MLLISLKNCGNKNKWPKYDPASLEMDEVNVVVQVNGKLRDKIDVPRGIEQSELKDKVLAEPKIAKYLEGKQIIKVIIVPEKLVNIVIK